MGNTCHTARTESSSRAPIFSKTRDTRTRRSDGRATGLIEVGFSLHTLLSTKTWKESRQASAGPSPRAPDNAQNPQITSPRSCTVQQQAAHTGVSRQSLPCINQIRPALRSKLRE